jgi:hypothetical protein
MPDTTATTGAHSRTGQHTTATQIPPAHGSPIRKETRMKSLVSSKPVLWFLFLFNLAVAVAVGAVGHHIHVHGQTLHGTQQILTSAGMGAVAIGAGAALFLRHRQRA